jgi:hypothetical protein
MMQRYIGDRLSAHQKQVIRDVSISISGKLQSISHPECCIACCEEEKKMTPLTPCNCTTTLIDPSSVKYSVEAE